jgi:hypothetical protein
MSHATTLLGGPDTLRERFTPTGRVRKAYGKGWRFVAEEGSRAVTRPGLTTFEPDPTMVMTYTVGPLGWMHNVRQYPVGTSFDEALRGTGLPKFYGWDR